MKQHKTAILIGLVLVVIAANIFLRYGIGYPHLSSETENLMSAATTEEAAFKVYRKGITAEATQALLSLAQLLQKADADAQPGSYERAFAIDLGLTYGRLGLLAEKAGNTDNEAQYFKQAQRWLAKYTRGVESEQQIRMFVMRVDQIGDRSLTQGSTNK